MRPLRELGEPVADLMGPMPYVAMQSLLDPLWGPGAHNYFKSGWLRGLDDRGDRHARRLPPRASARRRREIHVHHMGGAVARVPAGATAFGDRSAPFLLNIIASTFTADGYDDAVDWAQDLHGAMDPALTGGTYVNFLSDEGPDRVRDAYGAGHVRPPARAQGRVRPDQPVPPQPEREAGLSTEAPSASGAMSRPTR